MSKDNKISSAFQAFLPDTPAEAAPGAKFLPLRMAVSSKDHFFNPQQTIF